MGGYGSGRSYYWSKRQTVEDCHCLCINKMRELGAIMPNMRHTGTWQWSNSRTQVVLSSLGYTSDMRNPEDMYVRLRYTATRTEESFDYKIRIERTPLNFGGHRYWFICPYTGKRVAKLYKASAEYKYASRHAFNLPYASQSETPQDRAIRKKWKILRSLGCEHDFPIKPKGMHWKTFERIEDEFVRNEMIIDAYLYRLLSMAMTRSPPH